MNKPTRKFESDGVSVAIWANEIETANGPKTVDRVTVERRYKDRVTGEWKSTCSFRDNELPRLILVLQTAYEYLTFRKRETEDNVWEAEPVPSEVRR
jgi:hypothetical protein